MNNIKLLKAQSKLAISQIDPRVAIGINNYIERLEKLLDASLKLAANIHPSTDPENRFYDIDPQDFYDFVTVIKEQKG